MLDGIDEGGDFKPRIEEFLTTFLVRHNIPLIATTRPEGYSKDLYEGKFERLSLAPLDRPQQDQIIENRLGPDVLKSLGPQVEAMNDSEGKSICSNPLMLSMVISIFQSGGGVLPSSRFELYKKALMTMLTRVDLKEFDARGNLEEVPDQATIEKLLCKIAMDRHFAHEKSIMPDIIESIVREDRTLRGPWQYVEAKVIAGRLPVLSCLEPTPLKLQFAHLSFQEFLVAQEWVRDCDEKNKHHGHVTGTKAILPLANLLRDPWWHNTTRMACHQSDNVINAIMASHIPRVDLRGQKLNGDAIVPLMVDCRLLTNRSIVELDLSGNALTGARSASRVYHGSANSC